MDDPQREQEHEQADVEDLELTGDEAEQVKGGQRSGSVQPTGGISLDRDGVLSQHNETLIRI